MTSTTIFGEVRLVGLLGSYYDTMHPSFLLLVLGLHRWSDRGEEKVANGIKSALTAEIRYLHGTVDERRRIIAELGRAMAVDAVPTSLRAFVPNGDDYGWKPDFEGCGSLWLVQLRTRLANRC